MPTPRQQPRRYRQVADELRRRIEAGTTPPGALLPSESTLMAEFSVARGTVREALALLRSEGLVLTEVGRGTYARPIVPVRRVASDRYRKELEQVRSGELGTSFTVDQQVDWSAYSLDKEFREVPATAAIADLFGVEPGTMLLERHFLFRTHGVPQQMSVSRMPLELVAGTPIAVPENEPWPGGNTAQLHSLGHTVTSIRERPTWRMPTQEETEALRIPGGVSVVVITRQTYVHDWVAEVAHIVMRADRVELDYLIHLD
ncbi:GntR family transcriptional regulator [Micromonospora sp. WMMD1155]|uniref:GntR family transcriptional regulator n=1 Tax=Micromonospora sp. WMMD1155 TaxID=3016094 RepID=UPI00249AA31B|nr:GntR family transcriptional regulator [Micromonospora sp. WMMD1155]WFE54589.1 GntR family transcriptional regulator [Micromonospora sp. WMMD1155]